MAFEYLEHVSDVCIRASAGTLDQVFCEAAKGTFSLMTNLELVRPLNTLKVRLAARTIDLLLVEWLGRLLSESDLQGLVFSRFSVEIDRYGDQIELIGAASGEPIDKTLHELRSEVKGVTYSGLHVWQEEDRFIATCVLDV